MKVWYLQPATWIALASLIVSILSLINSRLGTRTANKSYQLALAQDERTALSIDAYLSDAWSITNRDQVRHILLSVVFTNKAAAANSIVRAELSVSVRDAMSVQDYSIIELRLPSQASDMLTDPDPPVSYLDVPLALGPREAVAGWVPFTLTAAFLGGRSIEKISFVANDALGAEVRLQDIYPREVRNVAKEESQENQED